MIGIEGEMDCDRIELLNGYVCFVALQVASDNLCINFNSSAQFMVNKIHFWMNLRNIWNYVLALSGSRKRCHMFCIRNLFNLFLLFSII